MEKAAVGIVWLPLCLLRPLSPFDSIVADDAFEGLVLIGDHAHRPGIFFRLAVVFVIVAARHGWILKTLCGGTVGSGAEEGFIGICSLVVIFVRISGFPRLPWGRCCGELSLDGLVADLVLFVVVRDVVGVPELLMRHVNKNRSSAQSLSEFVPLRPSAFQPLSSPLR